MSLISRLKLFPMTRKILSVKLQFPTKMENSESWD